jgi:menaquinone-9 beta-reductase
MVEQTPEIQPGLRNASSCDVVVVGAGMAGKAASIELARAGLKVTCISPAEATRSPVGESLDWSAPELLKSLGLPMDHLIEARMATWKRHVTLRMRDGCSEHYIPAPWLGGPPLNIELRTLHLDRVRIDQELLKLTTETDVRLVPDKVVAVERAGKRVRSVRTARGANYSGAWFIDASGIGASLFAREFNLPKIEHGPAKVALWKYFPVSDPVEGTTLYMDPAPSEYLDWIWEIPVNPETISVGVVTTGALMKARRDQGLTIDEIFQQELAKFSRFEGLLREGAIDGINVTSFKCRVYTRTAGPNWLICGEAASMVDPITANGVTAALRHAAEASSLILKYRTKGRLPLRARICYSSRILQMAKFFNGGIEKIVYEPPVRNQIGLQKAGAVYTSPAWSMNVVYARLKPGGIVSTLLLNSMLGLFRLSAWVLYHLSRRKRSARDSNDQCRVAA